MNLSQRWCDLTVAQYIALDRGTWVATLIVQTLLTALGGWLFYRWRRARDARQAAEAIPYPYPVLCLNSDGAPPMSRCTLTLGHGEPCVFVPYEQSVGRSHCEAPSPESPHVACSRPRGHHPDVHWNEAADSAWPVGAEAPP